MNIKHVAFAILGVVFTPFFFASAATVYFYPASDLNWTTTDNWFSDAATTTALGHIPEASDSVVLYGSSSPLVNVDAWVEPQAIDATQLTGDGLVAGPTFTSSNFGEIKITISGNATFNGSTVLSKYYQNQPGGLVTGNAIFNDNSQNWYGDIMGNASFYSTSANVGRVHGDATFYCTQQTNGYCLSSVSRVVGNAHFPNLTGYDIVVNSDNWNGDVGGTITTASGTVTGFVFNNNSSNEGTTTVPTTFNDTSNNHYIVNSDAVFNDSSTNQGGISTVTGNATFNGANINWGTVNGNATFSASSLNRGYVGGDATFHWTSFDNGDVGGIGGNASFPDINTQHVVIPDGVELSMGIGGSLTTGAGSILDWVFNGDSSFYSWNDAYGSQDDFYLSQPVTFNGTSKNWGFIRGNVTFNWTVMDPENIGTIDGDAYFPNIVGREMVIDDASWYGGVTGSMTTASGTINHFTFSNNGYNRGVVPANATFDATSMNFDTVDGDAEFNWTDFNSPWGINKVTGDVTLPLLSGNRQVSISDGHWSADVGGTITFADGRLQGVTFNGENNYNDGVIDVPTTFNDLTYNQATITARTNFNDDTINYGTVIGIASFRDNSINTHLVTGIAFFHDHTVNSGTVRGIAIFDGQSVNDPGSHDDTPPEYGFRKIKNFFARLFSIPVAQADAIEYANTGTIEGDATFYNDSIDNSGTITGTKTRVYTVNTVTTRDFTANGPWIVVADGAVVDVTGATFNSQTVFKVANGGSFVGVQVGTPTVQSSRSGGRSSSVAVASAGAVVSPATSLESLKARLNELLSQLALAKDSGAATTGNGSSSFTKTFGKGSSHSEVKSLQTWLNAHGFIVATDGAGSPGQETDYYGNATIAAVKKLQASAGISQTGYFGPLTQSYVNTH